MLTVHTYRDSNNLLVDPSEQDLSHRLCSSVPVSRKILEDTDMKFADKGRRTYRENFTLGVGCKKPTVVDGPHLPGLVQSTDLNASPVPQRVFNGF